MSGVFFVFWTAITYTCPGGFLGGFVPEWAKPAVCTAKKEHLVEARASKRDALKVLNDDVPNWRDGSVGVVQLRDGKIRHFNIVPDLQED